MPFKMNHSVSIDIMKTDTSPVVRMKQGDRLTRAVTVKLLSDGDAWAAPSDVSVLQLAYCKSDKVGGCYDHMPDNTSAGTFNPDRTAVTMQLHPQVLNVAGDVTCELRLLTNDGEILNAFNFIIYVQKSPIAMTLASEGYYNNVFDGATFIPHISADGVLSWTNDKNLPNPPPVNLGALAPDVLEEVIQAVENAARDADHASQDAARAAEAAEAAAEAVEAIPDWAKQAAKPDYQANEIDYHTTFLDEEVGTVDDALAVAEEAIKAKTGCDASHVELTKNVTFGDTESDNVQDALEAAADEMEKKISEEDVDEIEVVTSANAEENIASDNKLITPAGAKSLSRFDAVYGVTTFAEVEVAFNASIPVFIQYTPDNQGTTPSTYELKLERKQIASSKVSFFHFAAVYSNFGYYVSLRNNNTWNASIRSYVGAINEQSTTADLDVPNVRAVIDYVNAKLGGG